jgi:type I restriction enzyme S subunit
VPESEWPYRVPGNWVWVRLGSISKINPPKMNAELIPDRVSFVPMASVSDSEGRIVEIIERDSSEVSKGYTNFVEGDVIFAKITPCMENGKIAIASNLVNCVGFGSTEFYVFRALPVIDKKLLYHYLRAEWFREIASQNMAGAVGQQRVRKDFLEMHEFPLPPLAEQHRIVDRIESLFEKLDQAKVLIQEALDSFENRKAAILHKAFSGELTKKWREDNGVGMESWETRKLGQCGNWYGGGTPSKSRKDYWENGNIPWVSPKDMKSMYIENAIDRITQTAINESSTRLIPEGAILIVVRSGILRRILPIALTRTQVTLNQDMKALIPKGINAKYLYWLFVSKEASIRTECAKSGTTVESINSELLYKYEITVPPITEQVEIAQILDDIFENEINAQTLMDAFEDVDVMKKSILARAFRGELGTNEPNEVNEISLL